MQNENDSQLVNRCLQGEGAACEMLLDRYRNRVFSYVLRLAQNPADAEDIAQETFIKAFSRLNGYNPKYQFSSWLFRIAHNSCMDFFRSHDTALVSMDDDDAPLELPDGAPGPEEWTDLRLSQESIEQLLASLPIAYREVVLLRYKEDLSCAETAQALDIPEGTVKVRLFRAREMLKGKLAALGVVLGA